MNPSPILRIRGIVRTVDERTVPPAEPLDERRVPGGFDRSTGQPLPDRVYPAREGRPGYTTHDVVVDTNPGGFVSVVFRDEAVSDAGGYIPTVGEEIEIPVRAFDAWKEGRHGRYRTNGYSFAGKVYADEAESRTGGRRAVEVA